MLFLLLTLAVSQGQVVVTHSGGPHGCEVRQSVQFEAYRARLSTPAKRLLADVADVMRKNPALVVSLEGHLSLGEHAPLDVRRAEAVRDELVRLGIDAARFKVGGFAERRPVADNKTPGGRERNRRVEFTIISGLE